MSTDIAVQAPRDIAQADTEQAAGALAHILATGDLAKLTNEQRVSYYLDICKSLSLNPRSRPFDWLLLDGKLVLYPNKSCAEQLRRAHQIRVRIVRSEPVGANTDDPMFVVKVEGTTPNGRTDEATKYVPLTVWDNKQGKRVRLRGEKLANAYAKAETGAKRRLVLSMVGLASPPDPEEVKSARFVTVDGAGRILDNPTPEQKALAADPGMAASIGEPTYEDLEGSTSPLDGEPDQRVTDEELRPPERPSGPRPSFKNSDEDIQKWRSRWFAAVRGTSLEGDDARARFIGAWTHEELGWRDAKQTDSLTAFLKRATADEAEEMLAHVSSLCEGERRELLEDAGGYAS